MMPSRYRFAENDYGEKSWVNEKGEGVGDAEVEEYIGQLLGCIKFLEAQLSDATSRAVNAEARVDSLQVSVVSLQADIASRQETADELSLELSTAEARVAELKVRLNEEWKISADAADAIAELESKLREAAEDTDAALGDLNECAAYLGIEPLVPGLRGNVYGLTLGVRGVVDELRGEIERLKEETAAPDSPELAGEKA